MQVLVRKHEWDPADFRLCGTSAATSEPEDKLNRDVSVTLKHLYFAGSYRFTWCFMLALVVPSFTVRLVYDMRPGHYIYAILFHRSPLLLPSLEHTWTCKSSDGHLKIVTENAKQRQWSQSSMTMVNLLCGVGLSPLVWIHNLQLSPEKRSQPSPPWSTSVAAIFTYSTRNSSTASQTSPESSDSHISHHRYAVFRVRMLPITLY